MRNMAMVCMFTLTAVTVVQCAYAIPVYISGPEEGNSWLISTGETTTPLDALQFMIATTGNSFESIGPFWGTAVAPTWSQSYISSDQQVIAASGDFFSGVGQLSFELTFNGTKPSSPVTIYWQSYNDGVLTGDYWYRTDGAWGVGSGWMQRSVIPEPISMVMLGCMGAGMLVTRRLRRKEAV